MKLRNSRSSNHEICVRGCINAIFFCVLPQRAGSSFQKNYNLYNSLLPTNNILYC